MGRDYRHVIIIIILIVGALYFWGAKLARGRREGLLPKHPRWTFSRKRFPATPAKRLMKQILEDIPSEEAASADISSTSCNASK